MIENFKIAVIGSGTMGNGIAHTAAQSGFKTFISSNFRAIKY